MTDVSAIFQQIKEIIKIESNNEFMTSVFNHITTKDKNGDVSNDTYQHLITFLTKIIQEIDTLATEIQRNDDVLISVKHQKVLRTCFQIISSFGIASSLISGIGISLSKRCTAAQFMSPIILSDEEKYTILVKCTDFLHRCYNVPVLKNIIITFHLIDYLAALIQLAFAPLKKPGVYPNFTMTVEMYETLNKDRQKYVEVYEYLVSNCFQPILMKELLVLQNVQDKTSPMFVKRVIAKELSRRLLISGGLLSLIRCFIESQDTGLEWKKVEMICKIVSTKHGNQYERDYLTNITAQLKQIFTINNTQYLVTAVSCLMTLYEKYKNDEHVKSLVDEVFKTLNYDILLTKSQLPGTIILTPHEIEHSIQILNACMCLSQIHIPELLTPNLYVLFLLRIKCTKNEMKLRISNIILKTFELVDKIDVCDQLKKLLFGEIKSKESDVMIEEFEAGLVIKYVNSHVDYPEDEAVINFMEIFNASENITLISNVFEACLQIFVDVNNMRDINKNINTLSTLDEEPVFLSSNDKNYASILKILSEVSTSQKVVKILQENPLIVINFVGSILLTNIDKTNDECVTIALVLLNTILSNTYNMPKLKDKLHKFVPKLEKIADNDSEYVKILCKESIALILSEYPKAKNSPFEEAVSNIFDNLLPVRAHGIIELSKLIDEANPETICKRHYVFCLLQEQLKDTDSYIYLSAINCLASLASHCTADVLSVLCKEYLKNEENQNINAEFRMKIGDVIVKVTKNLGEMAVVHKSILLNTILCACRDEDPMIRASALSNLAEIALAMNYKMGSIIYEVLVCIWSIIETDKAIECRRAAVMVISSLLKGLEKETLVELKENLLPIYRILNKLYKDSNEDSVVRIHAQMALEELNDIVKEFMFTELPFDKEFSMLKEPSDIIFK